MTTTPDQAHRVAVTFPVAGETLDVDAAISVFHRWIREGCALEGLLIDVADYRHVPDGPGVLLIGLDRDRSIEFSTGEVAIRSMSKRPLADDLTGRLQISSDLFTLSPGLRSVVGRAVVLHEGPDDCHSEPSGASGPRIACGVIRLE